MNDNKMIDKKATISGIGLEASLILHIPNNKNFIEIEKISFLEDLKRLQGARIDESTIAELRALKERIKIYCYDICFFTYESKPALELDIYDYRDRVRNLS